MEVSRAVGVATVSRFVGFRNLEARANLPASSRVHASDQHSQPAQHLATTPPSCPPGQRFIARRPVVMNVTIPSSLPNLVALFCSVSRGKGKIKFTLPPGSSPDSPVSPTHLHPHVSQRTADIGSTCPCSTYSNIMLTSPQS